MDGAGIGRMSEELTRAIRVLKSPVCQCGRRKELHLAVCTRYWTRLPVEARNALRQVGNGLLSHGDQLELGI